MVLRQYLIAVCGTTGVGKSRFAIDMALRLPCGAKIINADAMQAYEGTDILTNKVPHSERKGVEHLLMSFKKPGEQYIVGEWVKDAIREVCLNLTLNLLPDISHPKMQDRQNTRRRQNPDCCRRNVLLDTASPFPGKFAFARRSRSPSNRWSTAIASVRTYPWYIARGLTLALPRAADSITFRQGRPEPGVRLASASCPLRPCHRK